MLTKTKRPTRHSNALYQNLCTVHILYFLVHEQISSLALPTIGYCSRHKRDLRHGFIPQPLSALERPVGHSIVVATDGLDITAVASMHVTSTTIEP